MSQSLGERLREAREAKGLSISDVAEQTRISALYLESIENDDYKPLPGGIFNKGFVKSYAKFVGIDENDALSEYQRMMYSAESAEEQEFKVYRPEVLTDDNSSRSLIPSAILAVVALGILTAGVLYFVDYIRKPAEELPTAQASPTPAGPNGQANTDLGQSPPDSNVPDMSSLRVEIKALSQPVALLGTKDGEKLEKTVKPEEPFLIEPKQELTLNYNRWNATAVQMSINGTQIALPAEPLDTKDKGRIIFTISKENLSEIWARKAIVAGSTTPTPTPTIENTNVIAEPQPEATPITTPVRTPVRTATPAVRNTPQPANANSGPSDRPRTVDTPRPTPAATPARPSAAANRPAATPRQPAANRPN